MRKMDLVGQRFGKLMVFAEGQPKGKNKRVAWRCQCDCGNVIEVSASDLRSGNTQSCGCSRAEAALKTAEKIRGRQSPKLIDLTGQRFGRLLVLRKAERKSPKGHVMWECQCDCGNLTIKEGVVLRSGNVNSCGCLRHEASQRAGALLNAPGRHYSRLIDMTGQRVGRLTVLYRDETRKAKGKAFWICRCDCGKITSVYSSSLRNGHTQSCGCLGLEHATQAKIKHGDSHSGRRSALYLRWAAIKRRCYNPNSTQYKYYGGKGVTMCKEWAEDFAAFRDWAFASGYKEELTIDRIDPEGNYEPDNCQWITLAENISRSHETRRKRKKQKGSDI